MGWNVIIVLLFTVFLLSFIQRSLFFLSIVSNVLTRFGKVIGDPDIFGLSAIVPRVSQRVGEERRRQVCLARDAKKRLSRIWFAGKIRARICAAESGSTVISAAKCRPEWPTRNVPSKSTFWKMCLAWS